MASTEEAKRLTGSDEAEETVGEAISATVAARFSTTAGMGTAAGTAKGVGISRSLGT